MLEKTNIDPNQFRPAVRPYVAALLAKEAAVPAPRVLQRIDIHDTGVAATEPRWLGELDRQFSRAHASLADAEQLGAQAAASDEDSFHGEYDPVNHQVDRIIGAATELIIKDSSQQAR